MAIRKIYSNNYFIQENGLIANPELGEGRLIPALVLDSDKDNGLRELLDLHKTTSSGDITVQWGSPLSQYIKPKVWHLIIEFSQPMEFNFEIEFDLYNDYPLIDAIYQSRALYISQGKVGEKVSMKQDDMILMEVVDTETDALWNLTLTKILNKRLRKNGVPKHLIKSEMEKHLKEMRQILTYRRK